MRKAGFPVCADEDAVIDQPEPNLVRLPECVQA